MGDESILCCQSIAGEPLAIDAAFITGLYGLTGQELTDQALEQRH
jgi:hypothetical protein